MLHPSERCCNNGDIRDETNAQKLTTPRAAIGDEQPFEMPLEFQFPESAGCPVSGEQYDPYVDRSRPLD